MADPAVTAPAAPAKPVANTAHKRQISEAIFPDERLDAPDDAPNEAPAAAQYALEGCIGIRKSNRVPKPNKRN
jgi:hypothetical protein